MTDERKPPIWERMVGEEDDAWFAFRAYRDSPSYQRSITRTTAKRTGVLSRWFRDHNWKERTAAYDAEVDRTVLEQRQGVIEATSREVMKEHIEILGDMRRVLDLEWRKLREKVEDFDGEMLKPRELIAMAETLVKLDRLVRGETTENVGTNIDLSKLSDAELETLLALTDKAKGEDPEAVH